MKRSEKQKTLWNYLATEPAAAELGDLCRVLGSCGYATFYRVLKDFRDQGYEIPCDPGGHYRLSPGDLEKHATEVGLGPEESAALLLLFDRLAKEKLRVKALNAKGHKIPKRLNSLAQAIPPNLRDKVRWIPYRGRPSQPQIFAALIECLGKNQRCVLRHKGLEREISPIRILSYRDVWYVDAYCHLRQALRSFALDRVDYLQTLDQKVQIPVAKEQIQAHYESSYGIFSGKAEHNAHLIFSPTVRNFVENEIWHPRQSMQVLPDGRLELSFPIGSQMDELLGSILSLGAQVEVKAPYELKQRLKQEIQAMQNIYGA